MNANQVQAFVDSEVQKLADRRIKPLIAAINGELETQRQNNAEKARLDALNAEGDKRIAALQVDLGKANTEVNDLAVKLAEATAGAANTGSTTPSAS
jgi:hypothetical protein